MIDKAKSSSWVRRKAQGSLIDSRVAEISQRYSVPGFSILHTNCRIEITM